MVGGEDGEGVGGLGFVVGVSGERSGVVAVVGLEGVSDGWVGRQWCPYWLRQAASHFPRCPKRRRELLGPRALRVTV